MEDTVAPAVEAQINARFCDLLEAAGYDPASMKNAEGIPISPRDHLRLYGQAWREFTSAAYGPLDPGTVIDPNF